MREAPGMHLGKAFLALSVCAACSGNIIGPPTNDPDGGAGDDTPIPPQDPHYADDHPRIYMTANRDRLAALLADGAPAATRFEQIVDGEMNGADYYAFSPWFAALMGQVTGQTSYCDYAVAQTDAYVAGEESLIASGQRPAVAGDSYLDVGGDIGNVMLTYDWCFAQTSNDQRARWLAFAGQAVWNVWHPDEAQWGGVAYPWTGWATNDPSDNYYYSFLRATMLYGLAAHDEVPDAAAWLDFFRVQKFEDQLVPTFESELHGGGSREGTGYGVSMQGLWSLYDLWQASTGEDLARQTTHTRASMMFELHAIVPTRDRIAPTGDQSRDSTASLFDYHRNYIQELTYLFHDDPVAPRAKWYIDNSSVPEMSQSFMAVDDFLYGRADLAAEPMGDLGTAYYGAGTGQVFARSSWADDATWINLVAGPYTQSHAHRDQGHLMVFKGEWLAYDANVSSHSGINQDEEDHNIVRIVQGGQTVQQHYGSSSEVTALHQGDGWLHVAADITPAYGGSSAVSDDEREVVFLEPNAVVVFDRVTTAPDAQQVWELNSPVQPTIAGTRATFHNGHDLVVERVLPAGATSSVYSWAGGDYSGGYRLDETSAGGAQQHLHVLSLDGGVTSITRSDADGRIGVQLQLADGRTATVRFGTAGVDGTLDLDGQHEVLGPGVDPLAP